MGEHIFQIVREPHQAIREFVVELRCVHCAARIYLEITDEGDAHSTATNDQGVTIGESQFRGIHQSQRARSVAFCEDALGI